MKLNITISPNLAAIMAAEIKAGEKAVTAAMRAAGTQLKSDWRGQITQAGLGRRLGNSIRNQTYPKVGESLDAAALVWSKAPVIIGAHDTGPLIAPRMAFGWRSRQRLQARAHAAAELPPANGNDGVGSGSGLSIAGGDRACSWPRGG
jgi:hypothetical protein